MKIHIYDGFNVLLRDLEDISHSTLDLRTRYTQANLPDELHIWCFDGARHNDRRKTVFPDYKAKRKPFGEERFAQIHVFREALTHSKAVQVECETWEADDLICALVKRFSARGDIPLVIHTNDLDYAQLRVYPMVHLNGVKPCPCPPHRLALYKATVGDASDNIPGIPSFGPKSFAELEPYWAEMERCIEESDVKAILKIPFKKQHLAWLADRPNLERIRGMLAITHFLHVPDETLDKGISYGKPDPAKADQLFRKFFL